MSRWTMLPCQQYSAHGIVVRPRKDLEVEHSCEARIEDGAIDRWGEDLQDSVRRRTLLKITFK
ncbi:MAG: hypothetical protein QXW02_01860 [Nitrososphaerota archaeon]